MGVHMVLEVSQETQIKPASPSGAVCLGPPYIAVFSAVPQGKL